ncbi:MAG: hypothetical protein Q3959_05180 [Limosilactobacillus sp.]|uniref:YciI family protein n=1 Tax=Limosilactobacillus sp. TaxID=2773925 RepID=UPI00270F063F|nr:hypothetical protein [Limosilactobacillus sp.]
MYIIDITLHGDTATEEKVAQHRAWFKKHFDEGDFVIVGPSKTKEMSGTIITKSMERAKLDEILGGDAFYPNEATYEVNEIDAKLVKNNIDN